MFKCFKSEQILIGDLSGKSLEWLNEYEKLIDAQIKYANEREESMYRRFGHHLALSGLSISVIVGVLGGNIIGFDLQSSIFLSIGLTLLVISMGMCVAALIPPFRYLMDLGLVFGKKTMFDCDTSIDIKCYACNEKLLVYRSIQEIIDNLCIIATFSMVFMIVGISLTALVLVNNVTVFDVSFISLLYLVIVAIMVIFVIKKSTG